MKMFTIFIVTLLFSISMLGQSLEGGIKGGFNFAAEPKIETENTTITDFQTHVEKQSTAYHVGLFAKVAFVGFYIRPELLYAHYKSSFLDAQGNNFSVQSNRMDFPLLIGFQPIKSVYFHGGLVAAYYFGDENDLVNVENSDYQDFKFGMQFGTGLVFNKISLEGRYELAFSDRTIELISDNSQYQIETNPSQFMISMGYKF